MSALAVIVFAAFVVEATAGFGATVVTVTLAAHLLPMEQVLATCLPANVLLSLYLSARYRAQIARGVLLRRVLPLMGAGMLAGVLGFSVAGRLHAEGWLKAAFAAFVLVLSALELLRRGSTPVRPLAPLHARGALLLAGLAHGLFACGGPLCVYVLGREGLDKGRFRATLGALWLVLGALLCASYAAAGALTLATLRGSLLLLLPLCGGLLLGEWIHRRLPGHHFRRAVFVLLLLASASLLARALLRA